MNYAKAHCYVLQFSDWGNIDGQHPRLPVLNSILENTERKFFDTLLV